MIPHRYKTPTLAPRPALAYPPAVIDGELVPLDLDEIQRPFVPCEQLPALAPEVARDRPGRLRLLIEDPYWVLYSVTVALGVGIAGTALYGIVEIAISVYRFFATYGQSIASVAVLLLVLLVCGGGRKVAKCAGLHCGGCKG